LLVGALITGSVATFIGVTSAGATTGNAAGLPVPSVRVAVPVGDPFLGRFYLTSVERRAHVMSGVIDMLFEDESYEEPFFYAQTQLHVTGAAGNAQTLVEWLYPFRYSHGRLSAGIVEVGTVTDQDRNGTTVGRISFAVPKKEPSEVKTVSGELTLNGRGPFRVTFKRTSDDLAIPEHLPKAKQTGRVARVGAG
jgi:hypothetical protein